MNFDEDFALALKLQQQYGNDSSMDEGKSVSQFSSRRISKENDPKKNSLIDPSWEYIDPTPDVHALFIQFDNRFFWGKLKNVEVRWSPRMTSCAGVCCYEGRGGLCSVRLSVPLLKLRPRKDLVETLLHEMIHAYLFVTHNNHDRDGHGPEFHKHMYRINKEAGTKISVYHNFHDEVKLYQQHWWRCNGPCQKRPPYYGMVKRSMNRPPGPSDFWWKDHEASCGGKYIKVKEPEGFSQKSAKQKSSKGQESVSKGGDIRNFFSSNGSNSKSGKQGSSLPVKGNSTSNVFGFGDFSHSNSNNKMSTTASSGSNIVGFKDLNGPTGSSDRNKPMSSSGSNIVGFKDLSAAGESTGKNKGSNNLTRPSNKNNKKPISSPKRPAGASNVSGDNFKTPTQNGFPNKPGGRAGGMLANKGGGTLVVTAKGNRKDKEETKPKSVSTSSFVPFSGKGNTLGSSTTKSSTMMLVSPEAPKSLKRHSPNSAHNGSVKKSKNSSIVDLASDTSVSLVNCPICRNEVNEHDINNHLDNCLSDTASSSNSIEKSESRYPSSNEGYSTSELDIHVNICSEGNAEELQSENDTVKCAACNKTVTKSEVDAHLEMCLGNIFEDSETTDDLQIGNGSGSSDIVNQYPCPCCALLLEDSKMNAHLDLCLAGVWDDFNSKI